MNIQEELKKRLVEAKINPYISDETAKVLIECFTQYKGFLKAQRVYDARLCVENQFKTWRKGLISMGFITYPEHPLEPWKHYPGDKIKDLFPMFEPLKELTMEEKVNDLYKILSELTRRVYTIETAIKGSGQPSQSKQAWGRSYTPK